MTIRNVKTEDFEVGRFLGWAKKVGHEKGVAIQILEKLTATKRI